MNAWPLLFTAGRRMGARFVVLPGFLDHDDRLDWLIDAIQDGDLDSAGGVRVAEVTAAGRPLTVVHRRRGLSTDGVVRIWSTMHGNLLGELRGHTGRVTGCAFGPDGTTLLTTSWDHTARFWELDRPDRPVRLAGHGGWLSGGVLRPDGRVAYTASYDGTVRVWDPWRAQQIDGFTLGVPLVGGCAVSSDDHFLAAPGADDNVYIIDLVSRTQRQLPGHGGRVTRCVIEGHTVASASRDGTIRLWDAPTGRPMDVLASHDGWVADCAFGPDADYLLSAGWDGTARMWGPRSAEPGALLLETVPLRACAVAATGRWAAFAQADGNVVLVEPRGGSDTRSVNSQPGGFGACALSYSGELLATTSVDDVAELDAFPVRDAFGRAIRMIEGYVVEADRFSGDADELDWDRLHAYAADALGRSIAAESTGGVVLRSTPTPVGSPRRLPQLQTVYSIPTATPALPQAAPTSPPSQPDEPASRPVPPLEDEELRARRWAAHKARRAPTRPPRTSRRRPVQEDG